MSNIENGVRWEAQEFDLLRVSRGQLGIQERCRVNCKSQARKGKYGRDGWCFQRDWI